MLAFATIALCIGTTTLPQTDDTVRLTLVAEGGAARVRGGTPQRAAITADKPATLRKEPADLKAPLYGTIGIGRGHLFVLDEPAEGRPRLFVDTNANGDLTDDPPADWVCAAPPIDAGAHGACAGLFRVDIGDAGTPLIVTVKVQRPSEPIAGATGAQGGSPGATAGAGSRMMLQFLRDYLYEGTCTVNGQAFKAALVDDQTRGSFTKAGTMLMLDLNSDGVFDSKGEGFDVTQPFALAGHTWEVANLAPNGSSFRVVRSTRSVPASQPVASMAVGKVFAPFEATDTTGAKVSFPGDYAGKIVLVDFWATWCAPCMREMPALVQALEKYGSDGFEILGVSLDSEAGKAKMPQVMERAKMTWRQIADGRGWKAALAQQYGVRSIPAAYLVDGTTGTILGAKLRGAALEDAIRKALAERPKS